jgi:transcriptional regulator with XRE-family HTH domain
MSLSETLRTLMADKSLSIEKLAQKTGVPSSTIKTWLSGSAPRKLEDVRKIARFLDVSFEFLCFGETTEQEFIISEEHLEQLFSGLLKVKIERVIPSKKKSSVRK